MIRNPGRAFPHRQLWRRLATATFLSASGFSCVGAAQSQTIDYVALEELFQEPVTASATGQPQRESDVPANMIIVTADDIRRSGGRNVPDVLRHVAGVDVMEWTNADVDVGLRGYDKPYSARVLVLIDGRQVYADHYGFMPWNILTVELSAIRQIEIVKGPNAALFGFNAVGGVINIVTRDPSAEKVGAASVSIGTQNSADGSIVQTFDLSDWLAMRLSAGGERADEFSTPTPAGLSDVRQAGSDGARIAIDAVAQVSDRARFRFGGSIAEADRNEMASTNDLAAGEYRATSLRGSLESDSQYGLIEATAYADTLDHSTMSTLGDFHFFSRLFVARLQDVLTVGAHHTFRVSIEGRTSSSTTTQFAGAKVDNDIISLGGMWNWRFAPELSLTNAIRVDHVSLGRTGPSPAGYPFSNVDWDRSSTQTGFNSGLVWQASDRDTWRFIAARGAQLPSLAESGAAIVTSPLVNFSGSPMVKPAITTDLQIDWRRQLLQPKIEVHANLFWQQNTAMIDFGGAGVVGPGGLYVTSSNRGNSFATGLELGLSSDDGDGPWRWEVAYRFEDVDDDFRPPSVPLGLSIAYDKTTPEHLVNARVGWTGGRWELDAYVRYQSDTNGVKPYVAGIELDPVDAFATADGRIAYALTDRVTLAVSGLNLFTAPQRQTSGPDVERRVLATLSQLF